MNERQGPRSPVVVLDWNLLQSMPASLDVRPHYACIVPAQAFHEVATKDAGKDAAALTKLRRWAMTNVQRLWVGCTPEYLFERQMRSDGGPLSMRDMVNPSFTHVLRRAVRQRSYDWTGLLAKVKSSPSVQNRTAQIAKLVELCDGVVGAWRKHVEKRLPLPRERGEWIRQPQFVTDLVERCFAERWRKKWRRYLDVDPNRIAIIRWTRFVAWYCLRRAEGQTFKFENNFDDAHYGLLASYTGHLGTADKGLAEAATAIFPGLRVIGLSHLVHTDHSE